MRHPHLEDVLLQALREANPATPLVVVLLNGGPISSPYMMQRADAVLEAMTARPEGAGAVAIGTVTTEHPGVVVARTSLGATRIVDRPLGEQLPRIC